MINPFTTKVSIHLASALMDLEKKRFSFRRSNAFKGRILGYLELEESFDSLLKPGKQSLIVNPYSSFQNQTIKNLNNVFELIFIEHTTIVTWDISRVLQIYNTLIGTKISFPEMLRTEKLLFQKNSLTEEKMQFGHAESDVLEEGLNSVIDWAGNPLGSPILNSIIKVGIAIPLFAYLSPFQDQNERMLRLLTLDLLQVYDLDEFATTKFISLFYSQFSKYKEALIAMMILLSKGELNFDVWLGNWVELLDESLEHIDQRNRVFHGTPVFEKIKSLFETENKLSISEIASKININRNTLKPYLKAAVDSDFLIHKVNYRLSWYERKA